MEPSSVRVMAFDHSDCVRACTGGQQAVLTLDMPENVKLANGCLNVLSAGK